MGLLSEGGVHSHSSHLYSILDFLKCQNLDNISLHLFTDGRDSNPNDGVVEISKLLNYIDDSNINLASICGRYYPMDRDSRWERIKLAYDAIVNGIGEESFDIIKSVKDSYANGVTDEFIKPIVCMKSDGNPVSLRAVESEVAITGPCCPHASAICIIAKLGGMQFLCMFS